MDIMLDVETLGKGSNAAVIAIGAVAFNMNEGIIGDSYYASIDPEEASVFGSVDMSTITWWMDQSEEARKAIFNNEENLNVWRAVNGFRLWIEKLRESDSELYLWGNGSSFDNVVTKNFCQQRGATWPFKYNEDMDVRTLVRIGREILGIDPKNESEFLGVKHNALDDAIHQAKYCMTIWKELKAM